MQVTISEIVSNNSVATLRKLAGSEKIRDAKTVYSIVKILRRSDQEMKELQFLFDNLWEKIDRTKFADMSDEDKAEFDRLKTIEIEKQINEVASSKTITMDITEINSQLVLEAGFTALDLFNIDSLVSYQE